MGRRARAKKAKTTPQSKARHGRAAWILDLLDPGVRPRPDSAAQVERRAIVLLAVVSGVLLLPFIGIAFHIDDPLFIWAADHIRHNPANPYAFRVNWYGVDTTMADVTKNPPLASYYIALASTLVGWHEVGLHLAFLVPAIALAVGMYLVAARMCAHPLLAALVGVLTPVFLVSSLTVMSDVVMLAFWVFAVYWWIRGVDTTSHVSFVLAAVLIALAALSKYFGMMLIPLLAVYSVTRERGVRIWMLYFLIPIAALVWYQWVTSRLYSHGLLIDAASYATGVGGALKKLPVAKTIVTCSFAGGCTASVLFFVRRLWSGRELLSGLGIAAAAMLIAQFWTSWGASEFPAYAGSHWLLSVQVGIWTAIGASLVCLAALDLWRSRDADSLLLFLWTVGTFVFAGFVNWSTNGRSILPMIVPAGILVVRRLELNATARSPNSTPAPVLPLALAGLLSLAVVRADYLFAAASRTGAALIHERYPAASPTTWFQGHWGFQYYMQQFGAKPIDVQRSRFTPGDIVVVPTNNSNTFRMPEAWTVASGVIEVPVSSWLTTMSLDVGAGFYADVYGPLPFTFGFVPDERFGIYSVRTADPK